MLNRPKSIPTFQLLTFSQVSSVVMAAGTPMVVVLTPFWSQEPLLVEGAKVL